MINSPILEKTLMDLRRLSIHVNALMIKVFYLSRRNKLKWMLFKYCSDLL